MHHRPELRPHRLPVQPLPEQRAQLQQGQRPQLVLLRELQLAPVQLQGQQALLEPELAQLVQLQGLLERPQGQLAQLLQARPGLRA